MSQIGGVTGTDLRIVATVTCGQLRPLKFRITVCVYCSCRKLGNGNVPLTVSIQNVENTSAATALGVLGPGPPAKNDVLSVPPPVIGAAALVVTWSVVVERIVCPAIAACRTEFGLFTMPCVMPTMSAGGERNAVATERFCSGNGPKGAPPIGNGSMLLFGMTGPPAACDAVPCARIVVPCGIDARRTTVGNSAGFVVAGTDAQMPGSMCKPSWLPLTITLASEICCKYVRPNMLMSCCSRPRLGIGPEIGSNSIWSLVRFSSRKRSCTWKCGRQMVLKPCPPHVPARSARRPSGFGTCGNGKWTGLSR